MSTIVRSTLIDLDAHIGEATDGHFPMVNGRKKAKMSVVELGGRKISSGINEGGQADTKMPNFRGIYHFTVQRPRVERAPHQAERGVLREERPW